jgi:polyisoprenoid-binding protein YceI
MSLVTGPVFQGTFSAEPVHSSFTFAIMHSGLTRFRGSLSELTATLRADEAGVALDGSAAVASISITTPPQMREHVLGPDFFDTARHPAVTFRSTAVRLAEDGRAEVDGELTLKGLTRPVTATGRYEAPRPTPYGTQAAGLQLLATIDRRAFGLDWQMELPGGGLALGWDVELDIQLRLEQR